MRITQASSTAGVIVSAPSVTEASPLPVLRVRPWADPVVDELGFDIRSPYVERFWLGILGPSTTFLLRRLAAEFDRAPDGFDLDLAEVATGLGLAARGGRNSPFLRALDRPTKFGLARRHADTYDLRRRLPPLNLAQVTRLPESLRAEHAAWQAATSSPSSPAAQQRRARRLALGLLAAGESMEMVESELHRAHLHPAVAHQAVRWANAHLELDAVTDVDRDDAA
jgi:hypothetical protein